MSTNENFAHVPNSPDGSSTVRRVFYKWIYERDFPPTKPFPSNHQQFPDLFGIQEKQKVLQTNRAAVLVVPNDPYRSSYENLAATRIARMRQKQTLAERTYRLKKRAGVQRPMNPVCAIAMDLFRSAQECKLESLSEKDLGLVWNQDGGPAPSSCLCSTGVEAKTVVPGTSLLCGIHLGLTKQLPAQEEGRNKVEQPLPQDLQVVNPTLSASLASLDLSELVNFYDIDTNDKFSDIDV